MLYVSPSGTDGAAGANGSSAARTTLSGHPGETLVLNFSARSRSSSNRGIQPYADHWQLSGLTVQHAGDNGIHAGAAATSSRAVTAPTTRPPATPTAPTSSGRGRTAPLPLGRPLGWSFASSGKPDVTLGGTVVTP